MTSGVSRAYTNARANINEWLTCCLFWLDSAAFAYVELTIILLIWWNPNQSNRRPAVHWYFPLWWVFSASTKPFLRWSQRTLCDIHPNVHENQSQHFQTDWCRWTYIRAYWLVTFRSPIQKLVRFQLRTLSSLFYEQKTWSWNVTYKWAFIFHHIPPI